MGVQLRKTAAFATVVGVLVAALAAVGGAPAGALLPGVIDVAVSVESKPATVSPPGELVLLEVVVSNVGLVALASDVGVDLPAGSAYRDDLSAPGCQAAGDDVTCSVPLLAPGASRTLDVVAHTPPVPSPEGGYTTTATVTARDLLEPLEYRDNNTDTTVTVVEAPNTAIAAGLVEEGESLTLDVGDGRIYTLTVPQGVPGVIVRELAPRSGEGKICGTEPGCGDGFIIKFVEDHPTFKALDPMNPLIANLTFGYQDPCRGLGGACADMYWAPDDSEPVLQRMLNCPGSSAGTAGDGTARPNPCINKRYKLSGVIYFDMRLLSLDPLNVPPLLLK